MPPNWRNDVTWKFPLTKPRTRAREVQDILQGWPKVHKCWQTVGSKCFKVHPIHISFSLKKNQTSHQLMKSHEQFSRFPPAPCPTLQKVWLKILWNKSQVCGCRLSWIVLLFFKLGLTLKLHCEKQATIHQVTKMLTASKNVLFPGHNHLLTTDTDVPSLAGAQAIIKVSGHQFWWLAGGYDLDLGQV